MSNTEPTKPKLKKEDLPPIAPIPSVLPIDKEDLLHDIFTVFYRNVLECYAKDIFDFNIDEFTSTYLNTPIMRMRLLDAVKRIEPKKTSWTQTSIKQPLCLEEGNWDGRRSDNVLVKTKIGECIIARRYHGIMDGSVFSNYYDTDDTELAGVIEWMDIPI